MIAILIYFCLIIYKLLYLPPIKTIFFYWNIENYFCFFIFEYIFINAFIWFNSCSDNLLQGSIIIVNCML